MTILTEPIPSVMLPIDDEHAAMVDYTRSSEGSTKINTALADIDTHRIIVAGDGYFATLAA